MYLGILQKKLWLFNWEHEFGPNYVFAFSKGKIKIPQQK